MRSLLRASPALLKTVVLMVPDKASKDDTAVNQTCGNGSGNGSIRSLAGNMASNGCSCAVYVVQTMQS
jgi:hypothetical protein